MTGRSAGPTDGPTTSTNNVMNEVASVELGRRRFLQAIAAGATVASLPPWLAQHAADAASLGAGDGVVVLLTMGGGNDGLSTFVPFANGTYHDRRENLAIPAARTLRITNDRGLHPNLGYLKTLWDSGYVAVIDGVGHRNTGLSHFVSMAQYMSATPDLRVNGTGWLGRINDASGSTNPFYAVALDRTTPLVIRGRRQRPVAVPEQSNYLFTSRSESPTYGRQYAALQTMAQAPTGLGYLADTITDVAARAVEYSNQLAPIVEGERSEPEVVTRLRLAARLINADLGIRLISIIYGDFDSHSNQLAMHGDRMTELNAGLKTFFDTLDPAFVGRSLIVGTSEFGRRVEANGSGTDHGSANSLFAVGTRVKGGFHGQLPSLTKLDGNGNQIPAVDFRQVYANVIDTWLGADSTEIVGGNHADLGFLQRPVATPTRLAFTAGSAPTLMDRRASIIRLYLAYFDRPPDDDGLQHWSRTIHSGTPLAQVSNAFVQSAEFQRRYGNPTNRRFVDLVYNNVLNRPPDTDGAERWTSYLAGGGSRGELMTRFSESGEFTGRVADRVWKTELTGSVGRLYFAYFLRNADRTGLRYWVNRDLPLQQVSDSFAASPEFINRYGTLSNGEFVDLVYRNVLNRKPDADGRARWVQRLNSGTSRGRVMMGFSNSAEFVQRIRAEVGAS